MSRDEVGPWKMTGTPKALTVCDITVICAQPVGE